MPASGSVGRRTPAPAPLGKPVLTGALPVGLHQLKRAVRRQRHVRQIDAEDLSDRTGERLAHLLIAEHRTWRLSATPPDDGERAGHIAPQRELDAAGAAACRYHPHRVRARQWERGKAHPRPGPARKSRAHQHAPVGLHQLQRAVRRQRHVCQIDAEDLSDLTLERNRSNLPRRDVEYDCFIERQRVVPGPVAAATVTLPPAPAAAATSTP